MKAAEAHLLRICGTHAKTTSADNCFTIGAYFKYIVPSYINGILPNKVKADCVFKNDMTFAELHSGDVYETKQKVRVQNAEMLKELLSVAKIVSIQKQRDIYFCGKDEEVTGENLLRLRTIFDDDKNEYIPTSLVHKGTIKSRKDNKITRPINLLIKEGDFFKIFKSEKDFVDNMKFAQFDIDRIVKKTRTRIKIGEQELTIDNIENEGVFIEFGNDVDFNIIQNIIDKSKENPLTNIVDITKIK